MNYILNNREPKVVGSVLGLFVSKLGVNYMRLDRGGVLGDKFYQKNIDRSVLISTIESYELARAKGIEVSFGSLGENILMDFNPYNLPQNSRIKVGDEVVLEISQHCTLCKSLTSIDNRLPKLLKDDRGIFARVIKNGEIKSGDRVYIL